MLIIETLIIFLAGAGFGGITMADIYQSKLDHCQQLKVDYQMSFDDCKADLKLCELRQDCKEAVDARAK